MVGNMEGWLTKVIEVVKLPARYVFGLALASSILLFLPPTWLARLRVGQFVDAHGDVIGIVFVASFSLAVITVLLNGFPWLWKRFELGYEKRRFNKEVKSIINELDDAEKRILRVFFYPRKCNTVLLSKNKAETSGLISKKILKVVGDVTGFNSESFPMRINPAIRRHLSAEMFVAPEPPRKVVPPKIRSARKVNQE